MADLLEYGLVILGAVLGFVIGYLLAGNKDSGSQVRSELREMNKDTRESIQQTVVTVVKELGEEQQKHLVTVGKNISDLQISNEKKLDEMRQVVDEKLQTTLEKRIGESFKLVSERLEAVHKGLGDMQNLATDVGGLKKVLSNVSTRGAMGEIQAEKILQQILAPAQYSKDVKTHPDCRGQVEFAIKLPGIDGSMDEPIWLPIDCKFPKEDYERLLIAYDEGDKKNIKDAHKTFAANVTNKAKKIRKEYVAAPHTTEFAVMFLPTEGLYAEVVKQPGLFEALQRDHQIVVTGPSTLAAFVNSLQMGFRTLALESNASEVYNVLGTVKTEFVKFGDMMTKLHDQLNTAANTISNEKGNDSMMRRLRAMERTLRDVEAIESPTTDIMNLLEE